MRRQAFLLGLFATGSQTLLLRELTSTLNGSELFIGTALFGWLVWVALGAYLGGKFRQTLSSSTLLLSGAILLPVVILLCRLSPLLPTGTIGEFIPFSVAFVISITAALPHGIISGLLFPVIARTGNSEQGTILRVYLVEGIGACVAGVGVTLTAGYWLSTLSTAIVLAAIVIIGSVNSLQQRRLILSGFVFVLVVLLLSSGIVRIAERALDAIRYPGYEILRVFDTPYTHQTLLERDSTYVLMTDNTVEASYPDVESAENLLLPAMAYLEPGSSLPCGDSLRVIEIGRPEFGFGQLLSRFVHARPRVLDARYSLHEHLSQFLPFESDICQAGDPITFMSSWPLGSPLCYDDVISVDLGDIAAYKTGRLLNSNAIRLMKYCIRDGGLVLIMTHYDSDRYLTPIVSEILGTIYHELGGVFQYVTVWPGTKTLFLASDRDLFGLPNDSVFARLSRLNYEPQFVHEMYLRDRLSAFKVNRLIEVLKANRGLNTIDRPTLVMKQALYRAQAGAGDKLIAAMIFEHNWWLITLPICFLILIAGVILRRSSPGAGVLLYIVGGLVSLTVELLIFYLYQSSVGALTAHLAALIGVFMLGLAVGVIAASSARRRLNEIMALGLLLLILLALLWTGNVPNFVMAGVLFVLMFAAAAATGGLFVAATRRYYAASTGANRGLGYAVEIAGSAIGALLTTTVLLPTIGVSWILISCLILTGLLGAATLIVPPTR